MNETALNNAMDFLTGKKAPKNKKDIDFSNFDGIKVGIASPQKIKTWSYGEVKKPETINYRTLKPEKDGLLCQRIFGPVKDYECECGKYRWIKFKGVVCDRCGVEVTESKVRRERMGHIELAAPVAHIWFLRKSPSRIGLILGMKPSVLEKVVYYAAYVVLEDTKDPITGRIEYKKCDVLTDVQLEEVKKKFPKIKIGTGAGAIKELLEGIELNKEIESTQIEIESVKDVDERVKLIKKLQMLESFLKNNTRPEWMIMTILPVIPPDLRPLVPLEGGRFASSDLNDLYRRIINRNNRLKHIESLRAPQVMIFNEKRLLQEAVDALIENGGRGKIVLGSANRPLKSLSDILKGKQGRFRQNLLGKRVDYSGRSVIVVGPELKLNQCGLPKEMALELFKPFVLSELIKKENITLKIARKKLEHADNEIWDILERVTKRHPVMLNRAPTLHRLGIQAFEPVLIEGLAIRLHPLTCAAFNADFDGDQMAVHVPISPQAQIEAKTLMMGTNNIISPASGKPIASPSHDMVLGINYLTKEKKDEKGSGKIFSDFEDVLSAYQRKIIGLHAPIKSLDFNKIEKDEKGNIIKDYKNWKDYTTAGRIIFFSILPEKLKKENLKSHIYNKAMGKKDLSSMVDSVYKNDEMGHYEAVKLLDNLMNTGFHYATLSGLTISIADMKIPEEKNKLIKEAEKEVKEIEEQAAEGIITDNERYNRIVDIWTKTSDNVADLMFKEMKKTENESYKEEVSRFNSVFMMADSGARGSRQQVRQLGGMRGLMAKPQKKLIGGKGEIIENPIKANFREGLTVLEYFISTHGGRKGLSDTALKTADAGYLTRRLVDVAHNVVITEEDCGTTKGVEITDLKSGNDIIESMEERIVGRIILDDTTYIDEEGKKQVIKSGEYINSEIAKGIRRNGIEKVNVRSVLTCESENGVCSKCFGVNLSTNKPIELGEAVGIIAAQSIGEPGTQLTLRTFHIGGTASREMESSEIKAEFDGKIEFKEIETIKNKNNEDICISRTGTIILKGEKTLEIKVIYGSIISVENKKSIKKDDIIIKWNPHIMPIITEEKGKIKFVDILEGKSLHQERNKVTGIIERKIIEHRGTKLNPRIAIEKNGKIIDSYELPVNTMITVDEGEEVEVGDIIAKINRDVSSKTRDITGGLPRVAELFEVRKPKNPAIISRIAGVVSTSTNEKGLVEISVKDEETSQVETYIIPFGKHSIVYSGDRINVGEQLTDGAIDIRDVLEVKGIKEVQNMLVDSIQEVYRIQGVAINDKYIEIIVKQMLSNVRITNPGGTRFSKGEIVSRSQFKEENLITKEKNLEEASAEPILLGISKAALASDSFISAASFQETTRVLTDAATVNKTDNLKGLKENVIIGHLVPCGTGMATKKIS